MLIPNACPNHSCASRREGWGCSGESLIFNLAGFRVVHVYTSVSLKLPSSNKIFLVEMFMPECLTNMSFEVFECMLFCLIWEEIRQKRLDSLYNSGKNSHCTTLLAVISLICIWKKCQSQNIFFLLLLTLDRQNVSETNLLMA